MQSENKISFCVYTNQQTDVRFEEGLAIFFGLTGISRIYRENIEYTLQPAGMLVVNPFELYYLRCANTDRVICMYIQRPFLQLAGWKNSQGYDCYIPSGADKSSLCEQMRQLYAQVFEAFFQDCSADSAAVAGATMQLLALLQTHFLVEEAQPTHQEATMDRLKPILDYIHHHWNESISLGEIAQRNFLSAGYLSRFFQKHLHVSFSQYVRELRLRYAAQQLTEGTDSITHIAYACGFGTPGVFIEAFRQQYGITPKQYRERQRMESLKKPIEESEQNSDALSALVAYIRENKVEELPVKTVHILASCDKAGAEETSWPRILNIGYARDGLMAPVQQQILQAQREIGFSYLRFHGLFDEDMHIYNENDRHEVVCNFTYAVMLFDFILSTGLKPFVELSFMPRQLAREQTQIFDRSSIISGCRDLDKWTTLVQNTIRFLIKHYGKKEVERWRFTTIAQGYAHIGCITAEEHMQLYCRTWHAVKSIDPDCQVGGPSGFAHLLHEPKGIPYFFQNAIQQNCIPDFITIQCYPHMKTGEDTLFMNYTLTQQSSPAVLSGDDDFLLHSVNSLRELMVQYHLQNCPIYLEEVNATLWQRDLSSDTCYKAAWLTRNVCATQGHAVFGYWLLTDLMEERATLEALFHGGYGLMTYNGIPKAGYQAMCLLSRLGNRILEQGPGWMLTEQDGKYQLMLYNFCPYSNLYRYRYKRLKQPQDAYTVFEAGAILRIQVKLHDLPNGVYHAEYFSITRSNGSSFDAWISIGAPQYPDDSAMTYLRRQSHPEYRTAKLHAANRLHFEITLNPHEVMLIVLHRDE